MVDRVTNYHAKTCSKIMDPRRSKKTRSIGDVSLKPRDPHARRLSTATGRPTLTGRTHSAPFTALRVKEQPAPSNLSIQALGESRCKADGEDLVDVPLSSPKQVVERRVQLENHGVGYMLSNAFRLFKHVTLCLCALHTF